MLLLFRVLGRSFAVIVGALSLDAVSGKIEVERAKLVWVPMHLIHSKDYSLYTFLRSTN